MTPAHTPDIRMFNKPIRGASKAIIMLHGRGGTADDLVETLQSCFKLEDFAILAPQATKFSWYPKRCIDAHEQNEPWLSSALDILDQAVRQVIDGGISARRLFFLGFSQGACVMLEYLARQADRFAAAFAYSGGLMGDRLNEESYQGSFGGMEILLGASDVDPHLPLRRLLETERVLREHGATVHTRIYPGMGHTINGDEVKFTNNILLGNS